MQSKTGLLGHSVYPTENVSKDLLFTYQDLKSCKPHEKTKQKHQKARSIDEEFDVLCFIFFSFDFQGIYNYVNRIWPKLLVPSGF